MCCHVCERVVCKGDVLQDQVGLCRKPPIVWWQSFTSFAAMVPLMQVYFKYLLPRAVIVQVLNLSGNSALFRGSRLQSQSMMLPKGLRHLDLSGCDLSGPLPASLATAFSLQHLNLSSNPRLSGNLPQMWTGLTSLQVLDVSSCGVKGSLPAAWATMQQLRIFKASSNKPGVSGKLPESWGILRNLEVLDVRWGRLTGSLPQIWADPAALAARSSDDVAATSQLLADTAQEAAELGDEPQMPRLSRAASGVAATPFQRSLDPRSTGRLGMLKLRELNLSGNRLTGQLPNKFAALKDLRIISLRGNKLNGPLPVQWAALENLEVCKRYPVVIFSCSFAVCILTPCRHIA